MMSRLTIRAAALCLLSVPLGTTTATAAVIHVDAGATGLANGSTWNDAFPSLQDALAIAAPGDELWVAEGTYRPDQGAAVTPFDRTASFGLRSGVKIYGSFLGFEGAVAARAGSATKTILSGDLLGDDSFGGLTDNSLHVVNGVNVDSAARLDGFTVTAGNADASLGNDTGGGIRLSASSPVIHGCRIVRNRCSGDGSGVTVTSSNGAAFVGCLFLENDSGDVGGGMWSSSSTISVINCAFLGNRSGRLGGGIYYFGPAVSPIAGCVFSGNTAADRGGAMFVSSSTSSPQITGCTVVGNSAVNSVGGLSVSTSTVVSNSILWSNTDPSGANETSQIGGANPITISYSCVQGLSLLAGPGNIGADPMLTDADGGDNTIGTEDDDVSLLAGSPCLDAGDNATFPPDQFDVDGDLDQIEPLPLDLTGAPRFFDDPAPDVGIGLFPLADMGARERAQTGVTKYGIACVGAGGFVPTLDLIGLPVAGGNVTLEIKNASGGSTAVLFLGTGQTSLHLGAGCFLNVTPVLPFQVVLLLSGSGPGTGFASIPGPLPPGTAGFQFTMQAFIAEPALPKPYSTTQGLAMLIL